MIPENEHIRVAAIQAAPIFPLNAKKTVKKVCALVAEAAAGGAKLVVFPETFIPAYPTISIDLTRPKEWLKTVADFSREAITVPGPEIRLVADEARKFKVHVSLGITERVPRFDGLLFNSMVFLGPDGSILLTHRKLSPSNREKVFWARGNGTTLTVLDTEIGRIGGLICAENLQPLWKYALMAQGEQIHCIGWPGWPKLKEKQGWDNRAIIDAAVRCYGLEGQCFVVSACMYIPESIGKDAGWENANWSFFGGTSISGPSGEYLAGPLYDQEGIVYADLDFEQILLRKALVDTTGRDARWDVVRLKRIKQIFSPFDSEGSEVEYQTEKKS
jgi:nitrilase